MITGDNISEVTATELREEIPWLADALHDMQQIQGERDYWERRAIELEREVHRLNKELFRRGVVT